jgi:hypothetical protein
MRNLWGYEPAYVGRQVLQIYEFNFLNLESMYAKVK